MSEPLVTLVRARTPSMLYALSMDEVQRGYSISQPMFMGNDGYICQWVEQGNDYLNYQLIEAVTTGELEQKVRKFMDDGYYMLFNTLTFSHGYLQWVARSKDSISLDLISQNTTISMVADARPVLRLVPVQNATSAFGSFLEKLYAVKS